MATKKAAATVGRTVAKKAGKPTEAGVSRAASQKAKTTGPSAKELDLRDRLKSGPRRPAGPPLVGDTPTQAAMDALSNEVVPEPTDPKKSRRRT